MFLKNFFYHVVHIKLARWRIYLKSFVVLQLCRLKFKPFIIRKNTSDLKVFRSVFLNKEFKLSKPVNPKFIIDAGAYTGLSTLFFAMQYPEAKIIAVEPEASNFEILKKHTASKQNIESINYGLWSKKTFLKVIDNKLGKWAFSLKEVNDTSDYDIHGITVKEILEKSGFKQIDILKIDIEGAEKELFSNNYQSWLDKVNTIIIELHDRYIEGCSEAVYNALIPTLWEVSGKGEKLIFTRKTKEA